MKIKYFSLFTLLLILSVVLIGCNPAFDNNTGMNNRDRMSTQTRIGNRDNVNNNDSFFNDGFDNGLNNGLNNNLNNGMTRSNQSNTNFGNMASRANEVANKIANLPEVSRASVVISNDTALVGCSLRGNTQGTMTNALRQKIKGIVKDTVDIDNVSVTTDPNMTNRIQTMSNSILQGNPIENFADDIRQLIRDITPNTNYNLMR